MLCPHENKVPPSSTAWIHSDPWFDAAPAIWRSYLRVMKCFLAIVLAALASTSFAEETTSVMCDGSGAAVAPVVQPPPSKSTAARKTRPPKARAPKDGYHAASKPAAGEHGPDLKDFKSRN